MLLKLFACVILIWTIIHQGTSRYVLSDLRIPWLQAAEIQTKVFAIPDIISLHSYKNLLKNEEEVWVGYFQRHIAIAYVGCASIDDHPFISVDFNKNYSPGLCLSLCIKWKKAQPIVGLSHNKCICLSSLPRSGVNKPGCDFQKTDWVDGDGDKIMALYEKKDIRVSGLDYSNGRKCLAFDKNQRASWKTCDLPNKSICKTKNEQFMKVIDGGQRWHLSWAEYIEKCSFYKCNPITYEDVLNRPNQLYDLAKSLSWTRLKQSIEIYEYNEYNNTMINSAYGYIKREGYHVILNFTKDGSVSKRALFETCSPYDQIDDIGLPSERCSDNEACTDDGISGHTYFILEKHTWESDTDDNLETKTKTETTNVYNTLNPNGDTTRSNKSGNTYDTTEKVAMKLKVQHDKNIGDDATENTYNHTGSRPVKTGKTDNVCGVLNNVEGEYDDVDTRNQKCQFNGGDTYSHIMKKY